MKLIFSFSESYRILYSEILKFYNVCVGNLIGHFNLKSSDL